MIEPVHVILNPTSGEGKGRRVRPELERELARLGVRFTIRETERPGHAVELAHAAAEAGAGTVIAVGGDGTVHEVVNGLLQPRAGSDGPADRPVLAVVPIGTGNDFIKAIAGSPDRRRAYEVLERGEIRTVDLGRVEWDGGSEYFINGAGTGIDVEVVRQIRHFRRLRGVIRYLAGLLRALVGFRPIPLRIRMDGDETERKVMIVVVANGHCLAGGFYLCPGAVSNDGWFDVCIVNESKVLQIARVLPRVLRGTHQGAENVTIRRAKSVEITAVGEAPLYFQVDGELREPPAARRLDFSLEKDALRVLAHPDHARLIRPDAEPKPLGGRRIGTLLSGLILFLASAGAALAQTPPGAPDPIRPDTVPPAVAADTAPPRPIVARPAGPAAAAGDSIRAIAAPQVPTPGGAFIRSLILPGWGQAAYGSHLRGGIFFAGQIGNAFMLTKTIARLGEARDIESRRLDAVRAEVRDSLLALAEEDEKLRRRFQHADSLAIAVERITDEDPRIQGIRGLIDARKQQREDWIAWTIFWMLAAGVDAFVNAHLSDFPAGITAEPRPSGGGVSVGLQLRTGGSP